MKYTMHNQQEKNARAAEKGGALVEVLIGLLIFTMVSVAAFQLLRVHVNPMMMAERQRKAATQSASLLNNLAARQSAALTDGGSFEVDESGNPVRNKDNTIRLNCSSAYCDQIIAVPQTTGTAYDFKQTEWTDPLPVNAKQVYTRAWSVGTLDDARHLRRITVAIFPSGQNEPLITQTVSVVLH